MSLRQALRNLLRTGLRSILTALGVIVGVAAVVAAMAAGAGARLSLERSFASLEPNQLQLSSRAKFGDLNAELRLRRSAREGLRLEDYDAIRREIRGISAITVVADGELTSAPQFNGLSLSVLGVDTQALQALGRSLARGTFFGEPDIGGAASICVIPEFLAHTLFGETDSVGRLVNIGNTLFTVIGVMKDGKGYRDRRPGYPGDTIVYVPYTSFLRRLNRDAKISVVLSADDITQLGRIQRDVGELLERRRMGRVAEFLTNNVFDLVRSRMDASRTLTFLLGSVGGIALVVGGIGIMNIMLVSVTERTREIGVRIALGTRSRDVVRQFVVEAVVLSACGGIVGLVAGFGLAALIARVSTWPMLVTPTSLLVAFLSSALVGVFFGYYPAKCAANLDPIQALRSE